MIELSAGAATPTVGGEPTAAIMVNWVTALVRVASLLSVAVTVRLTFAPAAALGV